MNNLIAITGLMGSGKTTAANILLQEVLTDRTVVIRKFAQPIYDCFNYVYSKALIPKPEKDRELMQFIGTHMREKDSACWIKSWKNSLAGILAAYPEATILTDDLRYDNEAREIKALGGRILKIDSKTSTRAKRITLEGIDHPSEHGISDEYIDVVINNDGDLEDLKSQLHISVLYL